MSDVGPERWFAAMQDAAMQDAAMQDDACN
jgi:hypothetical protein